MPRPRFAERFAIEIEQSGDVALLHVTGELVAERELSMDEAIDRVLAAGAKEIVIDLRNVSFIDSLGVRALIRNQLRSRDGGFGFGVLPGGGQVFRVVKTMGLDRVLHVVDDGPVFTSAT
jgi:anti-anti-sigma factor